MRLLNLIIVLTAATALNAQVKLQPQYYDNGFKYPQVVNPDKAIQDKINTSIVEQIADYEASDYCIGEYGYVQKGKHIEIHVFANCLEMQSGEHRYLFFNTETGENVAHKDLFSPKKTDDALKLIQKRIAEYKAVAGKCSEDFKAIPEDAGFEDFDIRLYHDGIEIRPLEHTNCTSETLRITWTDMKGILHYQFI